MTDVSHWDDVAHYQGAFKPTRAVIAKATQGTGYKDPEYAGNKSRAAAGDHHFGAYHFLEKGNATAQARFSHSVIGSVPAMLDIETYKGSWPSQADCVEFIKAFRALGGVMNVIYLPHWFWQGEWKGVSLAPLANLGVQNINSDYSSASDRTAMANFGVLKTFARQYTSTPHDMNRANMPFSDVWAIFTGKPKVTVKHPEGSRMLMLKSPVMVGHDVRVAARKIGQARSGTDAYLNGKYTPAMKAGVVWWQKQHHLTPDGIVGPDTWKSMGVKYTG